MRLLHVENCVTIAKFADDVLWTNTVCLDADASSVRIDMRQLDGEVGHVTQAGVTLWPFDDANAVSIGGISDANADKLTRGRDAVEVGMVYGDALRPTVFVDKDEGRARHTVATADSGDQPFAHVGFAGTEVTCEEHNIATLE